MRKIDLIRMSIADLSVLLIVVISFLTIIVTDGRKNESILEEYRSEKSELLEVIDELREEIEYLKTGREQEEIGGRGGAETPINRNFQSFSFSDAEFIFPIHEDNFRKYSSHYGYRISPIFGLEMLHGGIDILITRGTTKAQVVAVAPGVVVEHWPPPGTVRNGIRYNGHPVYGGYIVIDHGNGTKSHYAHLSSTEVFQGRDGKRVRVDQGTVIGRTGNTGLSTGEHLHFELYVNGKNVDPLLYIPDPRIDYVAEWNRTLAGVDEKMTKLESIASRD